MAKIVTVTANTAVDSFIELEGLGVRDNILAKSSREFACGKGVNIAKAVAAHGIPVVCLGFVGQQSLALFDAIDVAGLQTDFIAVAGKTRTNVTLFDTGTNRETHIRTPGFTVTAEDCRKLIDKVAATVDDGDIVIFSGSLPPGVPDGFYRVLIESCRSKGAMTFLDSSGAGLREGLQGVPYLIKPNESEFAELTGISSTAEVDILAAARGIIEQGIAWVYLSRGAQGAIIVGETMALAAHVKQLPGEVLSHVGCGDAMLAGIAVAILQSQPLEAIVKAGIACGAANLFTVEPGWLDMSLLPGILSHTEICRLQPSSK